MACHVKCLEEYDNASAWIGNSAWTCPHHKCESCHISASAAGASHTPPAPPLTRDGDTPTGGMHIGKGRERLLERLGNSGEGGNLAPPSSQ